MKLESFLFNPKDWLSDSKLGLCSYATKGAWMDIICYMHMSEKYGHLIVDGKPLSKDDVFNLLKFRNRDEFDSCWNELVGHGVMKYDESTSSFFSKRLISDRERLLRSVRYTPISREEVEFARNIILLFEKITSKKDNNQDESIKLITHWKRNGHSIDDFELVIRYIYSKWKDEEKMSEWIRPITIFKMDKFKLYLSSAKMDIKKSGGSSRDVTTKKTWTMVDPTDI
jgi:uncharacterized phage protein (TIGR02220 family)